MHLGSLSQMSMQDPSHFVYLSMFDYHSCQRPCTPSKNLAVSLNTDQNVMQIISFHYP